MAEHLFYDGDCGLCHLWVRFVLAVDPRGQTRFAPLGGQTFLERVPEAARADLPDSLVVATTDGRFLTRSAGVFHLLRGMGGPWRILGGIFALMPGGLADAVYDGVARVRHGLFPRPRGACPVVPAGLSSRFDP